MSGVMPMQSMLGYQPYQGAMPFQMQSGGVPSGGMFCMSSTTISISTPQRFDGFSSNYGGMMPQQSAMNSGVMPQTQATGYNGMPVQPQMGGMGSLGISGSTLQLMSQIATMMASVMQGLMSFVQTLMQSAQARQQASAQQTSGAPGTSASPSSGVSSDPSSGGQKTDKNANMETSGASLGKLSGSKEQRLKQIVDAAKRTYPDDPAMAKLAASQAVLESGLLGKPSKLATEGNNLFGIKGKGDAGTVNMSTQEQTKSGSSYSINAGFAKYSSLESSFKYHRKLMGNSRYKGVWKSGSLEDAAKAVRSAGYATDVSYSSKLTDIYNKNLAKYF